MASFPTLFYAPPGGRITPVDRSPFRHPVTGNQIFNPKPDLVLNLLPLDFYVAPPDQRVYSSTPTYAKTLDGTKVRMSWNNTPKPVGPVFQRRVAELKQTSAERAISLPEGFDRTSLDAALVHAVDALALGPGPYFIPKDDGTWLERTKPQLLTALQGASARINAAAANATAHYDALVVLRDANDMLGLLDYDITTGWPS